MHYKDILAGLSLALVYWALCTLALAYQPDVDFTDTGVGCVDDCLEPLIP
jgi:hypothetical protein